MNRGRLLQQHRSHAEPSLRVQRKLQASGGSASTVSTKQLSSGLPEKRSHPPTVVEYINGTYNGSLIEQIRTGLGIFAFHCGAVYFGEWKADYFEGEGILLYPEDGGFVHGFFQKGKLHGAAFFKFANGDIYEGHWRGGKLEGSCYKYFTRRDRWILSNYKAGDFSHVILKGTGLPPSYVFDEITSTQNMVERHATSTTIKAVDFPDGGQYIGVVSSSGTPTGLGIFRYSDGKFDVGSYKEGHLHGLGRLHLHNGDVYDGWLNRGHFQGRGLFLSKETGEWMDGQFHNNKCVQVRAKGQESLNSFPAVLAESLRRQEIAAARQVSSSSGLSPAFIEKETSSDVFSLPQYKSNTTQQHNFYLDLSIQQSSINNKSYIAADSSRSVVSRHVKAYQRSNSKEQKLTRSASFSKYHRHTPQSSSKPAITTGGGWSFHDSSEGPLRQTRDPSTPPLMTKSLYSIKETSSSFNGFLTATGTQYKNKRRSPSSSNIKALRNMPLHYKPSMPRSPANSIVHVYSSHPQQHSLSLSLHRNARGGGGSLEIEEVGNSKKTATAAIAVAKNTKLFNDQGIASNSFQLREQMSYGQLMTMPFSNGNGEEGEDSPEDKQILISDRTKEEDNCSDNRDFVKYKLPDYTSKDGGGSGQENTSNNPAATASPYTGREKSSRILELDNIRSEIAEYEQLAAYQIPERPRKARALIDDTSNFLQPSRTSPSFTRGHSPLTKSHRLEDEVEAVEAEGEELQLEHTEHVLDSIKQIKQEMLSQLHLLETKQNNVEGGDKSDQHKLQLPPQDGNGVTLRDDSIDNSPQHMAEFGFFSNNEKHGEQPRRKATTACYTEEEANRIAERIERNLTCDSSYYHNFREIHQELGAAAATSQSQIQRKQSSLTQQTIPNAMETEKVLAGRRFSTEGAEGRTQQIAEMSLDRLVKLQSQFESGEDKASSQQEQKQLLQNQNLWKTPAFNGILSEGVGFSDQDPIHSTDEEQKHQGNAAAGVRQFTETIEQPAQQVELVEEERGGNHESYTGNKQSQSGQQQEGQSEEGVEGEGENSFPDESEDHFEIIDSLGGVDKVKHQEKEVQQQIVPLSWEETQISSDQQQQQREDEREVEEGSINEQEGQRVLGDSQLRKRNVQIFEEMDKIVARMRQDATPPSSAADLTSTPSAVTRYYESLTCNQSIYNSHSSSHYHNSLPPSPPPLLVSHKHSDNQPNIACDHRNSSNYPLASDTHIPVYQQETQQQQLVLPELHTSKSPSISPYQPKLEATPSTAAANSVFEGIPRCDDSQQLIAEAELRIKRVKKSLSTTTYLNQATSSALPAIHHQITDSIKDKPLYISHTNHQNPSTTTTTAPTSTLLPNNQLFVSFSNEQQQLSSQQQQKDDKPKGEQEFTVPPTFLDQSPQPSNCNGTQSYKPLTHHQQALSYDSNIESQTNYKMTGSPIEQLAYNFNRHPKTSSFISSHQPSPPPPPTYLPPSSLLPTLNNWKSSQVFNQVHDQRTSMALNQSQHRSLSPSVQLSQPPATRTTTQTNAVIYRPLSILFNSEIIVSPHSNEKQASQSQSLPIQTTTYSSAVSRQFGASPIKVDGVETKQGHFQERIVERTEYMKKVTVTHGAHVVQEIRLPSSASSSRSLSIADASASMLNMSSSATHLSPFIPNTPQTQQSNFYGPTSSQPASRGRISSQNVLIVDQPMTVLNTDAQTNPTSAFLSTSDVIFVRQNNNSHIIQREPQQHQRLSRSLVVVRQQPSFSIDRSPEVSQILVQATRPQSFSVDSSQLLASQIAFSRPASATALYAQHTFTPFNHTINRQPLPAVNIQVTGTPRMIGVSTPRSLSVDCKPVLVAYQPHLPQHPLTPRSTMSNRVPSVSAIPSTAGLRQQTIESIDEKQEGMCSIF